MKLNDILSRGKRELEKKFPDYKKYLPYILVIIAFGGFYTYGYLNDKEVHVFHQKENVKFEGGRVIGNGKAIYQRKEQVVSNRLGDIERTLKALSDAFQKVNQKITENETKLHEIKNDKKSPEEKSSAPKDEKADGADEASLKENVDKVTFSEASSNLQVGRGELTQSSYQGVRPLGSSVRKQFKRNVSKGPSTISFPVQSTRLPVSMGGKVPAGSYLKAKLLTGVEASESRPVPVLLQADYFFIGPNKTKIDLSGCFVIAKSKGNLSIERVEMQVTKISCVSKSGKMFERSLNGFVADGTDSSFGITGIVNSKQSRVASMAFLSSVVEGIGSAIQQAQTTTQTNGLGGSSTVVNGDKAKYMAAGGASNAASLVTNWYLKHAQNLLPTINIGSGQDVWIVLQDTIDLPNWYFKKKNRPKKNPGSYSYMSRLTD